MSSSPRPTRTTNELHFTDLSPRRFEDLCLSLIFPLHPWIDIRHYGRSGADRGVDIFATERTEDGVSRTWFVQCRRYKTASQSTLARGVDDALKHASIAPQVLLIVVACDVSRSAHERCIEYASRRGVELTQIWTASILESMLRATRRDLLFSYFGISGVEEARERESQVIRNVKLKKRITRELRTPVAEIDVQRLRRGESRLKFASPAAIIRNVDDDTYPEVDSRPTGISGWFKLEFWNFYHAGIEFVLNIELGIRDSSGRWSIIQHGQEFDTANFEQIKLWHIARIPYRNIIDYDKDGDEYYSHPHLYCRFADAGMPYEGFRYAIAIEGEYPYPMDPALQFNLSAKVTSRAKRVSAKKRRR